MCVQVSGQSKVCDESEESEHATAASLVPQHVVDTSALLDAKWYVCCAAMYYCPAWLSADIRWMRRLDQVLARCPRQAFAWHGGFRDWHALVRVGWW